MIVDEIKKMKAGQSDIRKFGILIAVTLSLAGAYMVWRKNDNYVYILLLSAIFLVAGLRFPKVLRPLYRVWMTFAILMGWVMTRVILVFLFYVICTPIALLARITGTKFLEIDFSKNQASYWKPRKNNDPKERNYEYQH
jgi:hypothetical protein